MNQTANLDSRSMLRQKTGELVDFLWGLEQNPALPYEVFLTHMHKFKSFTQSVEAQLSDQPDLLREFQSQFKQDTDEVFQRSGLMTRARSWPLKHAGDYETLDAIYAPERWELSPGAGRYLDQYFLNSTLAVAVRSRLRKLSQILNYRAHRETDGANWLNLACGSCRELCDVTPQSGRRIWCVDTEPLALQHASAVVQPSQRSGEDIRFVQHSAYRMFKPERNVSRFGWLTTIYSVGLFDYIADRLLVRLLRGLYESLLPGGVLVASFKDEVRYETFDYHWLVEWSDFHQRTEAECLSILGEAGIPPRQLTVLRDETGVIIFFLATRAA